MHRFITSGHVHNELGKLVGVTGSLGFVCHSPKIITPSREGKLSYFKVTHY
ncbi:hypothetical protein SAMN04488238_1431, partial [Roseicitreum antarcticum]